MGLEKHPVLVSKKLSGLGLGLGLEACGLDYNTGENLPAVHTIVNRWTSARLLVSRAKDAINVKGLVSDLVKINQYRTLAAKVEFLDGSACTITKAYGLLKNM